MILSTRGPILKFRMISFVTILSWTTILGGAAFSSAIKSCNRAISLNLSLSSNLALCSSFRMSGEAYQTVLQLGSKLSISSDEILILLVAYFLRCCFCDSDNLRRLVYIVHSSGPPSQ